MDLYLTAIQNAPLGSATEDGNGYKLERTEEGWLFTEPSEDHPGYGEYRLSEVQAADVLENVFPGSFDSPTNR